MIFSRASNPGEGLRLATAVMAFILGGALAVLSGTSLACGCTTSPPVFAFATSLAFAALGGLALVEIWRQWRETSSRRALHGRRANWAVFAIVGLLLAVGVRAAMGSITDAAASAQPQRIVGAVEHLHPSSGGRSATRVSLKLDTDPRWFTWECRFYCGPYSQMSGLRDAPWPTAEAYVYRDRLVGLMIDGRAYLEPKAEMRRLIKEQKADLTIFIGIGILLALGAIHLVRHGPGLAGPAYRQPDSVATARVRRLVARTFHRSSGARR